MVVLGVSRKVLPVIEMMDMCMFRTTIDEDGLDGLDGLNCTHDTGARSCQYRTSYSSTRFCVEAQEYNVD